MQNIFPDCKIFQFRKMKKMSEYSPGVSKVLYNHFRLTITLDMTIFSLHSFQSNSMKSVVMHLYFILITKIIHSHQECAIINDFSWLKFLRISLTMMHISSGIFSETFAKLMIEMVPVFFSNTRISGLL